MSEWGEGGIRGISGWHLLGALAVILVLLGTAAYSSAPGRGGLPTMMGTLLLLTLGGFLLLAAWQAARRHLDDWRWHRAHPHPTPAEMEEQRIWNRRGIPPAQQRQQAAEWARWEQRQREEAERHHDEEPGSTHDRA